MTCGSGYATWRRWTGRPSWTSSPSSTRAPTADRAAAGRPEAPGAQEFGDRPGVERGAGRAVRGVPGGELADRAEAVLAEVGFEAVEQALGGQAGGPAGGGVGADQPGPHRALVLGVGLVAVLGGGQGTQAERGEQGGRH